MFETSIYTDSTAGEALDGVDGFNFQSASEGFTPTDQRAVREYLLHQVVPGWSVDNDPLSHPPSCRYRTVGDRYYLSRGRSTGTTYNGRPGNQLTQSLATDEADDFIPYRPAQLYGARRWSLEKASGKSLDPWATPLEIDPEFEADELKDELLSDPWARQMFPVFLTMIEQAAAGSSKKKLVIVHRELECAMKWIALGTLFLDPKRALMVRFAALVKNPLAVDAEIVGTSPVFDQPPPAVVGVAYNIFDLLTRETTTVEVSRSAAEQAAWFIEMDAEDALAAVDLARSWESALGAGDATRLARMIHLDGDEKTPADSEIALRAIVEMIRVGQDDDVVMYADELLSVALESPFSNAGEVRAAAQASITARQAGIDSLAVDLNNSALRTVCDHPELISTWAQETANLCMKETLRPVDEEYQRRYEGALVTVMNRAPADSMADLLVVAKSFGLRAPAESVASGLARFEELWSRTPGLSERRADRAYRAETTTGTIGRLMGLLEAGNQDALAALGDHQWHWVADEMRTPLDAWIAAADLAALPPSARGEILSDKVRSVGIRPNSWVLVMSGMDWPDDCRLVAQWLDCVRHVPASMCRWLADEITASLRLPDREAETLRPMMIALLQNGVQIDGPYLDPIRDDMRVLAQTYAAAKKAIMRQDNIAIEDFAARLGKYRPFFLDEIGLLLVDARDSRSLRKLASVSGDSASTAMIRELRRQFDHEVPVVALETALFLVGSDLAVQAESAENFLTELADSRDKRARVESFKHELTEEWASEWDQFLYDTKKGRLTRNLVRGGKRLFRKEI
ncbi:hypothetical protein [Rhodococcus pyridinivorans]|uniref:GAP1-N2 domain-containing protein n=1 Tax=Rhodococcus pyridinivorans TaxID=103816 RepID=UPI0020787A91|nr:hypothetical protein [Rhodococcus pyridinivorans]USI89653.1 hypothetical protein LLA01_19095 [Rhodococcus pyridinivorans]